MFTRLSFLRPSGVVVVDNIACKAVERGERGDSREVSDHAGIGPHRLYRGKVAPLRVDSYMTPIRGGDKAGRYPAIKPADDSFRIVAQELDELWLISGSTVRMLIRVVTSFVTAMVVFMVFSSETLLFVPTP